MQNKIHNLNDFLSRDARGLGGTVLICPECGREHSIPIPRMETGPDLVSSLEAAAADILGSKPEKTALIYDAAIDAVIKETFYTVADSLNLVFLPLGEEGHWLDSSDALGDIVADAIEEMGADLIIGAGSGVIADLTKWAATRTGTPFILYGTAASMNAHASITATITRNGVKTSEWLDPASAVYMDINVISMAPKSMRLAGLGDLAARSICNADWKLSQIIREKPFCPVPYRLTAPWEVKYLEAAAGIGAGEPEATDILAEASLVSALSMTMMAGETSPSSGAEHVFSHYWDLQKEMDHAQKNLHGIQVGLGTILSFALWEYMRELDISSIDPIRIRELRPSLEEVLADNEKRFGNKADLFNKAVQAKWIPDEEIEEYILRILFDWSAMWEQLSPYIGNSAQIRNALEEAGFDLSLSAIGRSRQQGLDAIIYGARYRTRYTMLDLAGELGVLPGGAEEILERSGL